MDIKQLLASIRNRVGYAESEHKDEVVKGAEMAHTIMVKRIEELERERADDRERAEATEKRLREQLQAISSIALEHAQQ